MKRLNGYAERFAFIAGGQIVRLDTLPELVKQVQGKRIVQLELGASVKELIGPLGAAFSGVEFEAVTATVLRAHSEPTLSLAPLVRFFLRPFSYILPLTYGADVLHGAINQTAERPLGLNLVLLAGFCAVLFAVSLRNIRRKWIY